MNREEKIKQLKDEGWSLELNGEYVWNLTWHIVAKKDNLVRVFDFYENGKTKREVNFKDEEFHGVSRRYDEKGRLKYESDWKGGKEDGI